MTTQSNSIPAFNQYGELPAGIHRAMWGEFENRYVYNQHRQNLLDGLSWVCDLLKVSGCTRVFVAGSFVTAKPMPQDFDAMWDWTNVNSRTLYLLAPELTDMTDERAAQKARFGGELFPAQMIEGMTGKTFLEFFQFDTRTRRERGIIELEL